MTRVHAGLALRFDEQEKTNLIGYSRCLRVSDYGRVAILRTELGISCSVMHLERRFRTTWTSSYPLLEGRLS